MQASIEYMRYLERCLTDLKAAHEKSRREISGRSSGRYLASESQAQSEEDLEEDKFQASRKRNQEPDDDDEADEDDEDEDEDEEMPDATPTHPFITSNSSHASSHASCSHQPSNSPAILPSNYTSPTILPRPSSFQHHRASHSALPSALPSPVFEAQRSNSLSHLPGSSSFSLTPHSTLPHEKHHDRQQHQHQHQHQHIIEPVKRRPRALSKEDDEATTALMMLNSDRRSWSGGPPQLPALGNLHPSSLASAAAKSGGQAGVNSSRGMSVRDLLSA